MCRVFFFSFWQEALVRSPPTRLVPPTRLKRLRRKTEFHGLQWEWQNILLTDKEGCYNNWSLIFVRSICTFRAAYSLIISVWPSISYQSHFFGKNFPAISKLFRPEGCPWNITVTSPGRMPLKYHSEFARKDIPEISQWLRLEWCPWNITVTLPGSISLKYHSDFSRNDVPEISQWLHPEGCPWNISDFARKDVPEISVTSPGRISLKYHSDFAGNDVPEISQWLSPVVCP
jgi:hypothetical protein